MHLLWLLLSTATFATPLHPRQSSPPPYDLSPDEKDTLELLAYIRHISHKLFRTGCDTFDEGDWVTAGFSNAVGPNICRMANQSAAHVDMLNDILQGHGGARIEPCRYAFVYSEPTSYVNLANEILMWSISAYLGALRSLTPTPPLLTLLTSHLTLLARHNGYLRGQHGAKPSPSTLDTPLPRAWSYTIAQAYITTCPRPLGYSVPPRLNVSDVPWRDHQSDADPAAAAGTAITVSYDPSTFWAPQEEAAELYLALVNQAYEPVMVPIEAQGHEGSVVVAGAVIPAEESHGVVFAALTTFPGGLTLENLVEFGTLAGPAEIVVS